MSEFTCPIIRIGPIQKHPNADSLSITQVFGENVIFRTGDFYANDLAVYIPVDAVVPHSVPSTSFLGDHRRIKAKRLRGVYSEGLLLPISTTLYVDATQYIGEDVAPILGIKKHVDVAPETWGTSVSGMSIPAKRGLKGIFLHWCFKDRLRTQESNPEIPVYDIEPYAKHQGLLHEGERVIITEKLHGCVRPGASITMADGSRRRIKDVQVGEYVLGMNDDGAAVASQVFKTFDNGTASVWLEIHVTNNNAGRGLSYRVICCTPNHQIFDADKNTYVEASQVSVGDTLLVNRLDLALDPLQEDVIIGKLLGDGSASKQQQYRFITWGHISSQEEYVDWTARCLGPLSHPTKGHAISGYGSAMTRRRTVCSELIQKVAQRFFIGPTKSVPGDLVLSPISLAFWYMDDGSLGHQKDQLDRANFAVCGFNENDCHTLINALSTLGIEAVYYVAEGYSRLRLNAMAAERMFLLIAPYIPACMQYKLPERFRGASAWFPKTEHKPALVKQTVQKIQQRNTTAIRRDLETATHNYFAGGILVHNSNSRFGYVEGHFYVGSHKVLWRDLEKRHIPLREKIGELLLPPRKPQTPKTNLYWAVAKQYDLENQLEPWVNDDLVFYGEIFGKGIQDLTYEAQAGQVWLRIFDIYDTMARQWLDWDDVVSNCKEHGLDTVPILYDGPFSSKALSALVEGKSVLAPKQIREGVVVKPAVSRVAPHFGRVILKCVSQSYKLRKGDTTELQ